MPDMDELYERRNELRDKLAVLDILPESHLSAGDRAEKAALTNEIAQLDTKIGRGLSRGY